MSKFQMKLPESVSIWRTELPSLYFMDHYVQDFMWDKNKIGEGIKP